jgi:Mg-chelatase subunit ChlD
MNRLALATSLAVGLALGSVPALAQRGELQVQIENLPAQKVLTNRETSIDVEGWASVFGGLKHLDLFLVLDTSESLKFTDPQQFRTPAAVELVRSLPAKSDIQVGLVTFDTKARLVVPLTAERSTVIGALSGLPVQGGTDLADGIRTALAGFEQAAREDSARIMLLFTDGKSDAEEALAAAQAARDRRTVIHALLLGNTEKGADLLRKLAETTGGSFVFVENPEDLPKAFANLRTTGVDFVKLSANGSAPIDTLFVAGTFHAAVPLVPGRNTITATATDLEGRTRSHAVQVTVTGPLRTAIAQPVDGHLFVERVGETAVEVMASAFDAMTPELTRDFPTQGIESVTLSANGSTPEPATFEADRFVGRVPLALHANRIVATARSFDGRVAESAINVTVRPPGCSQVRISAEREGKPAISLDDRGVEFIFDASNSMWGQIDRQPKIAIAKTTLQSVLDGLPEDLQVGLRVYGHQHAKGRNDCADSQLLAPLGLGNREQIRAAIDGFKPRGQTPLAYSLGQVAADFGEFQGDRAVVLITDGVESCNGDPVAAAQALQVPGKHRPVHVIGFGLEQGQEQAQESLTQIAASSGGKFITAGSGDELRRALAETAGSPYSVWHGTTEVGRGTLGGESVIRLPAGDYLVRLESDPPREFPFHIDAEQSLSLVLVRQGEQFTSRDLREALAWGECP